MTIENILTVVTPATSYDLTTLEIVKDELGVTDTNSDVTLTRWISESSERIRGYTERNWGLEVVTELFRMNNREPFSTSFQLGRGDGGRHHALRLTRYPIVAVTSIVEDDIYILVEGVDFEVDAKAGLVYRLFQGGQPNAELRWAWRRRKVFASYSAGYNLPDSAPLRLQQACQMLIKGRWSSRTRDPSLRTYSIPGVIEKSYWSPAAGDNDMPPEVAALLDSLSDRQF